MADQVEQIVVDLDVQQAIADADKLNAKLSSITDKAQRMSEAATLGTQRVILTTSQTTQNRINSALDSYSKSVAFRTGDTLKQATVEYQNYLRLVAGDQAAVARLTANYKELVSSIQATRVAERQRQIEALRYEAASPKERLAIRRESAIKSLGSGADPAQIAALTAEFNKLEERASAAAGGIGARIAEFITSPTYAARKSIGEFASEWGKFGLIAAGVLLVIGETAAKTYELIRESGKKAEEIVNLGARLGVTTSQAAVLSAQARIAGVSVDSFGGLIRKLSTDLSDGGNESRQLITQLEKVGVTVGAAGGKFKDPVDILRSFSEQINKMPDHAAQVDLLSRAFGRGAIELLPLIKNFAELEKQAKSTGVGLDGDIIERMAKVDDRLDKLGISWDRLKLKFAEHIVATIDFDLQGYDSLVKLFHGKNPFAVDALPPIKAPAPDATGYYTNSQRSGLALVDQFRSRVTLDGLQQQLQDLQATRDRAATGIVKGRDAEDIRQAAAQVASTEKLIEAKKEQIKIYEAFPAALKEAQAYADSANRQELSGLAKIVAEVKAAEEGYRKFGYSAQQTAQLSAARDAGGTIQLQREARLELIKLGKEDIANIERASKEQIGFDEQRLRLRLALSDETLRIQQSSVASQFSYDTTQAQQQRDAQIRAIENTDAKTLQQKVQFEIAKGEIESQFIATRAANETAAVRRQLENETQLILSSQSVDLEHYQLYNDRIIALSADAAEKQKQIQLTADAETSKARQEAIIKSAEAIRNANTAIFDRFKSESEKIFDAMISKSSNVFAAIGNALKNAVLTALKDAVSTQVARALTSLVTGEHVGLTPGTVGTGPFARIAAALGIGAKPTFGSVESKLQQLHIEQDGALRVHVQNLGALGGGGGSPRSVSQQVTQNFNVQSTSTPSGLSFGGAPLAAAIALMAGGGLAAASSSLSGTVNSAATGSGYETQSTINYAGGGSEVFGGRGSFSGAAGDLGVGSPNAFGIPGYNSNGGAFESFPQFGGGTGGSGGGGGIGGLLGNLKGGFGNLLNRGILLTGSHGTTGAGIAQALGGGIFGKIGGGLAAGAAAFGLPIGLGLLGASTKNPYKPSSGFLAAGGGGLAGFSLGAQGLLPGGAAGGALIGLGSGLLLNGIQRGGAAGFGEDIAGGALVGFQLGGPIGAAIGAAAGAIVGGLRWSGIWKSKSEKVHDQIKSLYGVDIKDRGYINQLVQIINQKYGGSVEAGIRSLEVRQMVQLYAQATGQNSRGIVATPQASIVSNTGNGAAQLPTYFNGEAVLPGQTNSAIGIPQLTPSGSYITSPIVGGANAIGGGGNISLSLDHAATTAILQGQAASVIRNSPRLVSNAASAGIDASASRRDIATSVLSPAFLTT